MFLWSHDKATIFVNGSCLSDRPLKGALANN